MTAADPEDVPLYQDADVRDLRYHEAQTASDPYLAVESVDAGGYTITFDLLPVDAQLVESARETLRERLVEELEDLVAAVDDPTTEVSHSLGPALGSVSGLERESAARTVAATIADIVLDESNWEANAESTEGPDPRSND